MNRRAAIVGAGWAGAACARTLTDAGWSVEVFEAAPVAGGHSRAEVLGGVVYEPNGAHIFHTSDREVAEFVQKYGMHRPFAHTVLTEVYLSDDDEIPILMSWPPQVDELKATRLWPVIEKELAERPTLPDGTNFETYVKSMMGPTLYRIFIEGYTRKHWGCEPSELAASIAPKRVELRTDGNRRLFRDQWEFFEADGFGPIIENVLKSAALTCNAPITIDDVDALARDFSALVVTAPLDVFSLSETPLAWRGIRIRARLYPTETPETLMTPAYQTNHPSLRVAYTRTTETKHATGQHIAATVVGEEYPVDSIRHYPVATPDGRHEKRNADLARDIIERSPIPTFVCGRLAEYRYINQDEAIRRGIDTARAILRL